ncbi:sec-independent protein translocase protein TATC, chloroplastic [Musa acuminata AAA Group]|uniref:sec-independent protein translocase protein TATC, chloroplastic n=1 Tax=Musa acuminata AAA Group TaxID=214697 RepID=UPI0031DDB66A
MGSMALLLPPCSQLPCCPRHRIRAPNYRGDNARIVASPSISALDALLKPFRKHRLLCSALLQDDAPQGQEQQEPPPQLPSGIVGSPVEETLTENINEDPLQSIKQDNEQSSLYNFLYPSKELLPDDKEMSIFDHLEELRQRIFVSVLAVGAAILGCFAFSKDLIILLEAPVSSQGVRFLQLSPGEFFFTTLKVSGYCGLLLGSPVILYEIIAFVLPGLTKDERKFLGPIVLGSSVLFYAGIVFSYAILTPAALNFFVNYAEGAVESLWSIDQYFEFVLILMFSTGLSFQVPVIQLLLGQVGLVSGDQMLSIWRYVVVGAVVAAAVLTPSTDPLTQILLAGPLLGLYLGGAWMVKLIGR